MTNPDLLKKCLYGCLQTVNQCFSFALWSRVPKVIFVPKISFECIQTLQVGALDGVITYKDGNKGRIEVLGHLRVKPEDNCLKMLLSIDRQRVKKAEKHANIKRKKPANDPECKKISYEIR